MQQTINKPVSNQHQTTIKPLSNQVRNGVIITIKPNIKPTTTPFRGVWFDGLIGLIHHIARLIASAVVRMARAAKEMDRKASQLAQVIEDGRKSRREREESKRELERLLSSTAIEPGMVVNICGEVGGVYQATIDYPATGHRRVTLILDDTRRGQGVTC